MPYLDGFQTALAMHKLGFEVPIAALTASVGTSDQAMAEQLGFKRYLTKPIQRDQLRDALKLAVNQANRSRARVDANDESQSAMRRASPGRESDPAYPLVTSAPLIHPVPVSPQPNLPTWLHPHAAAPTPDPSSTAVDPKMVTPTPTPTHTTQSFQINILPVVEPDKSRVNEVIRRVSPMTPLPESIGFVSASPPPT